MRASVDARHWLTDSSVAAAMVLGLSFDTNVVFEVEMAYQMKIIVLPFDENTASVHRITPRKRYQRPFLPGFLTR